MSSFWNPWKQTELHSLLHMTRYWLYGCDNDHNVSGTFCDLCGPGKMWPVIVKKCRVCIWQWIMPVLGPHQKYQKLKIIANLMHPNIRIQKWLAAYMMNIIGGRLIHQWSSLVSQVTWLRKLFELEDYVNSYLLMPTTVQQFIGQNIMQNWMIR